MIFDSQVKIRGAFNSNHSQDVVKNEPMFFNCDLSYAWENGGPITKAFIEKLPIDWQEWCDVVFDSRVHMLMPEWYPCIPGWHHDDVPRSTPTGQPNYQNPEYFSDHLCGLVNAEICPTLFALGMIEVSNLDINTTIYETWSKEIAEMTLPAYEAESGQYIEFDCNTFHTGVKAKAGGWRWFGRLSRFTERTKHITNETRRQVQVYLENPIMGW